MSRGCDAGVMKMTESRKKAYSIVEGSPIPTFVLDKAHRVIHWNKSLQELTGILAEKIIGTKEQWRAFYDHERPIMADLILDGAVEKIETYYAGKFRPASLVGGYEALDFFPRLGKTGKWLFFTAAPLFDEQGAVWGTVTTIQDVTDLKRIETELKDREARYRLLAENATDLIWTADLQMRLTYMSPSVERLLGYTAEEAMAMPLQSFLPSSSYQQALSVLNDELSKVTAVPIGRTTMLELQIHRKDGTAIWTETNATWLRHDDGRISGILGVTRDIAERKKIEDELRKSEEKFRLLTENVNDVIWIRDLDLKVTYVSRAVEKIMGYTPEEEMTHTTDQIMTPESYQRISQMLAEAMAREKAGEVVQEPYIIDVEVICKDGSTRWLEVSMNWLRNAEGRAEGIIGISRDVSERKQVELELRRAEELADQANQAKSQFLANVSHEIRTPMNGVLGMVELLKTTRLDDEQLDYVNTIQGSAESLLEIINDILDISKIEAGRMKLRAEGFDLADCLDEVKGILEYSAANKGLVFTVHYNAPRRVIGDKTRIRQILMNLVGNAIKFTEKGGITVRADYQPQAGHFRIAVSDTGIGIPENQQKIIFESFRQVDGGVSRKYEGTGLGLTIAKNMTELMGGHIELESREGRGTTFTVVLPLPVGAEDDVTEERMTPAVQSPVSGAYVMVAEDNPASLKLMETFLKKRGCHVDTAGSGQEVLDKLRRRRYHVVFMDISMPAPDGYETTRIIRDPDSPVLDHDVPIVAMTAYALAGDREKCLRAGMNDYLAKPINSDRLDEILARIPT